MLFNNLILFIMDKDFNNQTVSSADSAQIQEQLVNGSQSSSNLNIAVERKQSSSLGLPSGSN